MMVGGVPRKCNLCNGTGRYEEKESLLQFYNEGTSIPKPHYQYDDSDSVPFDINDYIKPDETKSNAQPKKRGRPKKSV
jgi:hypothetical protein